MAGKDSNNYMAFQDFHAEDKNEIKKQNIIWTKYVMYLL